MSNLTQQERLVPRLVDVETSASTKPSGVLSPQTEADRLDAVTRHGAIDPPRDYINEEE